MTREELIEVMADAIDLSVEVRGNASRAATAALAALEAAGVRLVPVKCPDDMYGYAGARADRAAWEAMLAASPYAPPGG